MKVLVTGGTGFIGSHIVTQLRKDKNNEVFVLTRSSKTSTKRPGLQGVQLIEGDVTNPASLKSLAQTPLDAVIHCVQFPNHPVQNPSKGYTYEKVDAKGTENLMTELKTAPALIRSIKRVVYVSGAGTSPTRTEPWFVAKNRAETAVRASGLPWVILRPSWVYGPGDRSLSKFVEFARFLPFMPVIGAGESRVAPVFIEDLALACVAAVTSEAAVGQALEIGGPRNMTMNEVQKTVLEVLGKNKPLVHMPIWMMKTAGAVVNATLPSPPFSPEAIDFITMDVPVDPKPAEKALGVRFRDLKTALESYLLN